MMRAVRQLCSADGVNDVSCRLLSPNLMHNPCQHGSSSR